MDGGRGERERYKIDKGRQGFRSWLGQQLDYPEPGRGTNILLSIERLNKIPLTLLCLVSLWGTNMSGGESGADLCFCNQPTFLLLLLLWYFIVNKGIQMLLCICLPVYSLRNLGMPCFLSQSNWSKKLHYVNN